MRNIIKKKIKKEFCIKKNVLFADFETVVVSGLHYVSVYDIYDGNRHRCKSLESVSVDSVIHKSNDLVYSFIEDCFVYGSNSIVYFHNFGRFDSLFVLRNIDLSKYKVDIKMRDNIYYEIIIFFGDEKVTFRDSYLLFPSSLNEMALLFLNDKKKDFVHNYTVNDYLDMDKVRDIQEYCKHDVYLLYMSFNKYRDYVYDLFRIDICRVLTLSSLSLRIFLTYYYNDKTTPITHSEGNIDSFIRRAYKGGVVDVYKPILQNGYCYDVNSLYPYVMSKYKMPSMFIRYVKNENGSNSFDIENFFGFVEVDVVCKKMEIPFLTYFKKNVGLISPVGNWKGVYFSEEIKYALKLGYQFKYYSYVSFKSDTLFKEFVNTLYDLRVKSKGTPLDKIIKLILNSLYGRFGMINEVKKCLLLDSEKSEDYLNELLLAYDVKCYENVEANKTMVKFANKPVLDNIQFIEDMPLLDKLMNNYENSTRSLSSAVQISAAITAYARIEMYKYKLKYNVYYSDTDSIFTDSKIDENDIGNNLGQMKLEYKIKHGLFIAPKLYYIEKEDNSFIFKGKGIHAEYLKKEHYIELYQNIPVTFDIKQKIKGNTYNLFIKNIDKQITLTGVFNKREKIYDEIGNWIGTYPYYVKDLYEEDD